MRPWVTRSPTDDRDGRRDDEGPGRAAGRPGCASAPQVRRTSSTSATPDSVMPSVDATPSPRSVVAGALPRADEQTSGSRAATAQPSAAAMPASVGRPRT